MLFYGPNESASLARTKACNKGPAINYGEWGGGGGAGGTKQKWGKSSFIPTKKVGWCRTSFSHAEGMAA